MPVDMNTFWASSTNKRKLQKLLGNTICERSIELEGIEIYLSGVSGEHSLHSRSVHQGNIKQHEELDLNIEEADLRIIPHIMHATRSDHDRIVVLSNDTDVFVLLCHYWSMFHRHGLKELWMKAGVGESIRYIPIHILGKKLGDLCQVLPALHTLSGCDVTSKVGTKLAALKANPLIYLRHFGVNPNAPNLEETYQHAESYMVQIFKKGSDLKTLDELRYWMYHHSKSITLDKLPPTSYRATEHIKRAFYMTYLMLNCLEGLVLDPIEYGFYQQDDLLLPCISKRIVPSELVQFCTCLKCSTIKCNCRKHNVPCCRFCKFQSVDEGSSCKNPHVILNIPFTM